MKILQVTDIDLQGRRFNGYDLQQMLNKKGIDCKQVVCNKMSNDENVISLLKSESDHKVRRLCREFEERISMQSVIYPFGELLGRHKEFLNSDIVHYHLLFNFFMSMFTFRKLTKMKPTVWTLHDPWALTGHCVHPIDCKEWLTGCKNCKHLDRYSPLNEDHAAAIWNIKKEIYKAIDIDIVVASEWMYDMVKRSPLTSHFKNIHLIPFGIDLDLFKRKENRNEIRSLLGIKKNEFVIMFRQDSQEWKGLPYIEEMLKDIKPKNCITLLTVGETGLLDKYKKRFKIIEKEWINDSNEMVELYSAADLFLMPSIAESFGLMAVEAMACSLPVIVFTETALPSVTFAPKFGIALEKGNNLELIKTIERLISSPAECFERGKMGRELAEKHYNIERYNEDLINLYKEIHKRNKSNSKNTK